MLMTSLMVDRIRHNVVVKQDNVDESSCKRGTFRWLRELLVLWECHESRDDHLVDVVLARNFWTYLLSSIRMVSMVNSLFHCIRHGSLEAST